jgi:hypothetical protein
MLFSKINWKDEHGVALVSAVSVLVILLAIGAVLQMTAVRQHQQSVNFAIRSQAILAAKAAYNYSVAYLESGQPLTSAEGKLGEGEKQNAEWSVKYVTVTAGSLSQVFPEYPESKILGALQIQARASKGGRMETVEATAILDPEVMPPSTLLWAVH